MDTENQSPKPSARPGGTVPMRTAADSRIPPHPLDKSWYIHVDGQTYGPYTGHEIKQMVANSQIHETDFVCPEGGNSWSAAKADPLIGSIFKGKSSNQSEQPTIITNSGGGTVVQVTNQIPNNNAAIAAALLMTTGDAAPKSPGIALLLSFFICGAGQMYNGQVGKGILMLVGFALTIWFFGLGLIIYIWSMVDAYSTAKQMNLRYQQRILAGIM
jgi:TM2 domain-containing membrane protein YozV